MSPVIKRIEEQLDKKNLVFTKKPVLIGGMAMEYYGIRKSGDDIDLVICDGDYQTLARQYPDNRKDIWGDLGVMLAPFEIWRCIMLLDYDFFLRDAADEGAVYVVSLDNLLLTRVLAMHIPKYMEDLKMMKEHYLKTFYNRAFAETQEKHLAAYESGGGTIWGGRYGED